MTTTPRLTRDQYEAACKIAETISPDAHLAEDFGYDVSNSRPATREWLGNPVLITHASLNGDTVNHGDSAGGHTVGRLIYDDHTPNCPYLVSYRRNESSHIAWVERVVLLADCRPPPPAPPPMLKATRRIKL